ncbi:Fatty acid-binding protein [Schistosoma japonicum]|uniref:Calycin-like domain-containing protein n=2 Tax=Schistosoma japonicum TaxID=6182 RepID=Q5DBB2_SCHJA|nr:SJCHGC04204 protein [Schistosoma japonicum]KAH8859732.1 14 kDa fatty acid-binding protein [Schistosoma japonicum]TNN07643.1 Fatty acid-binding protein [Schistosoma japonicum]CAX74480.1 Calycin-like domain-containing protein [Schistosoma japonicum]CAX74481.1 Calycin-like domain-containing protein [Schistosoma japonicum]
MVELVGTWKYVESSNLDELFSELGTPNDVFNTANDIKPNMIISMNDNEIGIKMIIGDKVLEQFFELGQEVEELTLDGRIVRAIVTIESDKKMIHIQKHGFTETVITREVDGDTLMTTIKSQQQVGTIKYHRV